MQFGLIVYCDDDDNNDDDDDDDIASIAAVENVYYSTIHNTQCFGQTPWLSHQE